ncbi:hypothetical protein UA08_08987 [Talaromyces atroroseus]|uniref:non-specific serine/threonine protein kinase n=1 Tax=Talaromyces atroroseus TaxID=1441469 RepID=A0A1Q5Q7K1_TALAT|nr:hypothetical protein UA08_08987 [Talaromyces atroroseus]OKL55651.1 hypothetical protein UA08_08987 [Talaromyces atroroseus]
MLRRKMRTSDSRLKATTSNNEAVVLGDYPQGSGENVRPTSAPKNRPPKEQPSGRIASKFRRSSAKLLSRLGFWSSGNSENLSTTSTTSSSPVDTSTPCPSSSSDLESDRVLIADDSVYISEFSDEASVKHDYRQKKSYVSHKDNSIAETDSLAQKRFEIRNDVESKVNQFNRAPVLPRRLSQKLSIFGPPTVIRRTRPKPRVAIVNMDGSCPVVSRSKWDGSVPWSTDPSVEDSPIFSQSDHHSSLDGISTGRNQRLRELQEHLRALPFTHGERTAAQKAWITQESEHLRQSRVLKTRSNRFHKTDTISTAGYDIIRVLGQGSFGVVQLVKEKSLDRDSSDQGRDASIALSELKSSRYSRRFTTRSSRLAEGNTSRRTVQRQQGNVYAMKVIRKADMVRHCQEGHIRAEREFLTASERSKWIVPLIASFQDTSHLYLVMEYEIGGDFFGLLIRHGVLSERDTMWYVAEMILCVEEAHRLGWIHRDVKPENFLISASGHLKLADFGLAFDGHWSHNQAYFNNHRYSLVSKLGIEIKGDAEDQSENPKSQQTDTNRFQQEGNEAFVPQVGKHMLDWRDRNEKRRFARSIVGTSQYMAPEIISGEPYDEPKNYHPQARHVYSDDARDIKAHRFFRQIPWGEMLHRRPPYIPEAKSWEDTNYSDRSNLDFIDVPILPQGKHQLMKDASVPESEPDPLAIVCQEKAEDNLNADKVDVEKTAARKRKNKERKRARDKILRDAVVGPTALNLRTKAAFVGYTWRRPKSVRNVLEIERGRSLVTGRF